MSEKIDEESKKALTEVKKGKARKFVIVKEGVQIDRLYVFKKGPYDKFVRAAKKDGVRGQAFWGVVRGDGLDIFFELSRTDGFDQVPGKDIRLKEFIKEEAGFKFDPVYRIVDTLATVDETDEEETEEGATSDTGQATEENTTAEATETASATETAPSTETDSVPEAALQQAQEDHGDKFMRLLKKILPHVKRALAASTSLSDELRDQVRQAQDLGRRREFEQGLVTLRIVAELAKKALTEAGSSRSSSSADPAAEIANRLQQLRGRIDAEQAQETSVAREISTRVRDAETSAGRQKFDRAATALQQLERLLDRARAETARRQQWEERLAQLEPRYNGSLESGTADPRVLRAVMNYSQRQAERKQYVKALVGLDRLDSMLSA
jgi:hypothetical protein